MRAGNRKAVSKIAVSTKHSWTPEKLKALATDKLTSLRGQAVKLAVPDLVTMCDAELSERAAKTSKPKAATAKARSGGTVTEYHFVCANSRGVTDEGDGTFRTGSWVVSEGLVQESLRCGAVVALHESTAEPSCRQGALIGFRNTPRDMTDRDNVGIEFHVQPIAGALAWVGDGAGEKGYRWE